MMFAQANSEHCRHKIFNAQFTIDGVAQEKKPVRHDPPHEQVSPQHTIVAYADNASIMEGQFGWRDFLASGTAPGKRQQLSKREAAVHHVLMKVETHNHPTAISPFPRRFHRRGRRNCDEGATGRGPSPRRA